MPELKEENRSFPRRLSLLKLKIILSVILFLGGVILLTRGGGWSLILGFPAAQVGLIFIIFNFDELSASRFRNVIDNLETQKQVQATGKQKHPPED